MATIAVSPLRTTGPLFCGVLLASAGFIIASVICDIRYGLFTLILIAISYPVYFFAVNEDVARMRNSEFFTLRLEPTCKAGCARVNVRRPGILSKQ